MKRMILLFSILLMVFTVFSQARPSSIIDFADPNTPASDSNCEKESKLRSKEGVTPVEFTLTNRSKNKIVLYWLNYEGKRIKYEEVIPGDQVKQPTFLTHPWVVTNTQGQCVRILTPPGDFVIQ